jgi:hypothetical protein
MNVGIEIKAEHFHFWEYMFHQYSVFAAFICLLAKSLATKLEDYCILCLEKDRLLRKCAAVTNQEP